MSDVVISAPHGCVAMGGSAGPVVRSRRLSMRFYRLIVIVDDYGLLYLACLLSSLCFVRHAVAPGRGRPTVLTPMGAASLLSGHTAVGWGWVKVGPIGFIKSKMVKLRWFVHRLEFGGVAPGWAQAKAPPYPDTNGYRYETGELLDSARATGL